MPAPTPRAILAARRWALDRAIEELEIQAAVDGAGGFAALHCLENERRGYQAMLERCDRAAAAPPAHRPTTGDPLMTTPKDS